MKKMYGILLSVAVLGGMIACKSNAEQSMKGVILGATMNTLTLIPELGDTVMFSTLNAERTAEAGILIGDTATVYYRGKLTETTPATRIVVVPGPREASVEGAWVEPVNGMPGQVQGIRIEPGGKASSVNMATLVYESWKRTDGVLILTGKSIGNGQTIAFSDTLRIDRLTSDSLILDRNGYIQRYSRQN